ncbi:hypothetical protein AX17_005471 [Amanita inopinata Kibby_2008]|nr:hypothetical protein AX17_005471 [Amanita inopinata Kibby_2008]
MPDIPWEEISCDIIGPLPTSKGFNTVVAVIDRFSKMIRLIPSHMTLTSKGLAEIYRDNIWKLHGILKRITSDRGLQYAARFMKELCQALHIQRNMSTAYHPETDGQVERSHQETEVFLCHFVVYMQDDWTDWIAHANFQYNNKVHSVTGHTPFYLNYSRHPWKSKVIQHTDNEAADAFVQRLAKAKEEVHAVIQRAQETMKENFDKRHKTAQAYKAGDLVFLEAMNITTARPTKKLAECQLGLFKIIHQVGPVLYELKLPDSWTLIHPMFHETLLTPYQKATYNIQKKALPKPPEVIGDKLEYEVEKILDLRKHRNQAQFLIKWKGYSHDENTWEPRQNLGNVQQLLTAFHKKYPHKAY